MDRFHRRDGFIHFDLRRDCDSWQAGFANYRAGEENFYQLTADCFDAPTNANCGLFLSGANHSDQLFMFIKRRIDGLKPCAVYEISARVGFLSKAPTGCIGAGGDPGASVFVKFGAATDEPLGVVDNDGMVRMNVDIGSQSNGGTNAEVIGDIATDITDCFNQQYVPKELRTSAPLLIQTDDCGALWIFVGTASGFEGVTSLFFTDVSVHLRRFDKNWRSLSGERRD